MFNLLKEAFFIGVFRYFIWKQLKRNFKTTGFLLLKLLLTFYRKQIRISKRLGMWDTSFLRIFLTLMRAILPFEQPMQSKLIACLALRSQSHKNCTLKISSGEKCYTTNFDTIKMDNLLLVSYNGLIEKPSVISHYLEYIFKYKCYSRVNLILRTILIKQLETIFPFPDC